MPDSHEAPSPNIEGIYEQQARGTGRKGGQLGQVQRRGEIAGHPTTSPQRTLLFKSWSVPQALRLVWPGKTCRRPRHVAHYPPALRVIGDGVDPPGISTRGISYQNGQKDPLLQQSRLIGAAGLIRQPERSLPESTLPASSSPLERPREWNPAACLRGLVEAGPPRR